MSVLAITIVLSQAAVLAAEAVFTRGYLRRRLAAGAWWPAAAFALLVPMGNAAIGERPELLTKSGATALTSPAAITILALLGLGAAWILLRYALLAIQRVHFPRDDVPG